MILQGLQFLHESALCFHGNLKSSNCVVNSRWTLKITDYGFLEMRAKTHDQLHEAAYYRSMYLVNETNSTVLVSSRRGTYRYVSEMKLRTIAHSSWDIKTYAVITSILFRWYRLPCFVCFYGQR